MAREGRELEKLVASLEAIVRDSDEFEIKSPDYIQGEISGSMREIDVSLRKKGGASDQLIIFECRDRGGTEGVDWIEQIASKRLDVAASKAVAISSSGFSSGAKNTAKYHNIALRTVDDITADSISEWFQASDLVKIIKHGKLVLFDLFPVDPEQRQTLVEFREVLKAKPNIDTKTPLLEHINTNEMVSVFQIWQQALIDNTQIFLGLEPNGERETQILNVNFSDVQNRYQILTDNGPIQIGRIDFQIEKWISVSLVPISQTSQYLDVDGAPITQSVRYILSHNEDTIDIALHNITETKRTFITVNTTSSD